MQNLPPHESESINSVSSFELHTVHVHTVRLYNEISKSHVCGYKKDKRSEDLPA